MEKIRKLFFETNVSWKRVIILSVVTAIIIGLIMVPDFLDDTSIQNPGITFEFWILWALFIILNSKTPLEAGAKTFVAFLISQPLIYLVQVPFTWMGWGIFGYYKRWFILTLLTFPGGMIAWYVKKGNALSVAILSVANAILCMSLPTFWNQMVRCFPHHILTIIFIIAEIVTLVLLLFKEKKYKIAAFAVAVLLLAAGIANDAKTAAAGSTLLLSAEGEAPYTLESEHELFTVDFTESYIKIVYREKNLKNKEGTETLIYKDSTGTEYTKILYYKDGDLDCDD